MAFNIFYYSSTKITIYPQNHFLDFFGGFMYHLCHLGNFYGYVIYLDFNIVLSINNDYF